MLPSTCRASLPQDELKPVPGCQVVLIDAENSSVEFVGTHVGDDPKPRLGGFKSFRGMVTVDFESKQLQSIELTFEINSIWTEFDKLTNHLMQADFFNQANFPDAHFRSQKIITLPGGSCNIQGELTLLGQTAAVNFPASVQFLPEGMTLSSQFILDRTVFGMNQSLDGIEKSVAINFSIGTPDRQVKPDRPAKAVPASARQGYPFCAQDSSVEFIGLHVGDDPKPRLGGFKSFRGIVLMNAENKAVDALQIDFEIQSIWTEFDKLTGHLLAADFFEADKYPQAQFRSTKITSGGAGECVVTGNLTLHGKTSEISFPASYQVVDQALTFQTQFSLDRTLFDMNKMTDGVEKLVNVALVVGKPDRQVQKDLQSSKEQKLMNQSRGVPVKIFLPNMLQY